MHHAVIFPRTERKIVMNYTYLKKCALIWIAIFVFTAAGAGAYAQQPLADAEVTFHVA